MRQVTTRRPTRHAAARWGVRTAIAVAVVVFALAYTVTVTAHDSAALARRLAPVLLFVAAMSVVVNLSARAGVFDRLGAAAARLSRGHTVVLWPCVVLLAAVCTAFLSLDTTAILVTPLVVALAAATGRRILPTALVTVWIANIGSLFLPVSNLTNLLAVGRRDGAAGLGGTAGFVALVGLPAAAALLVVVGFAAAVFGPRRSAVRRRRPHPTGTGEADGTLPDAPPNRLLIPCAAVLAVLLPLLASPVPYWASASAAAVLLVGAYAWADRAALRIALVPWSAMALALGLMLVVRLILSLGAETVVRGWFDGADGAGGLFALAGAGALAANLVNNLPAYLLLEPAADSAQHLAALLIGVNAGPVITPWASLATLLWADQLRRAGVGVPWRRFVLLGVPLALLAVGAATAVLAWTT